MGNACGISHARELVSVRFIQLLLTFEASKMMPFSIRLRDKIVEMSQMSSLFVVELGIVGDIEAWFARRRQ